MVICCVTRLDHLLDNIPWLNERKGVHELKFRELTKEQLAEESLINLAFAILEEKKGPIVFEDLIKIMQGLNGHSDKKMKSRLVQFYTDMNVDGRFLLENDKGWGLREWYKVEQIEEETAPSVKIRKKKTKAVVEDDEIEEELDEEEEIGFDEDFEEFVEEDDDDDDDDDEEDVIVFDTVAVIDDIDEVVVEDIIEDEEEFELDDEELEEEEI